MMMMGVGVGKCYTVAVFFLLLNLERKSVE